jgi:hypothetical protein
MPKAHIQAGFKVFLVMGNTKAFAWKSKGASQSLDDG